MAVDAAKVVETLMPGFRACVELCNDAGGRRAEFVPFSVEGKTVGYMLPSFTASLADLGGDVFKVPLILMSPARPGGCASPKERMNL